MVDERRESEPSQMSGLEGSGSQPPGSTQQRAGAASASGAMDEARTLADQARETASIAASEAGDRAYDAVETGRETAATGLERAASTLEKRASTTEGIPAVAAERAAEGMQSAAGYLRGHDSSEIWQDVEHYVHRYPVRSLLGAIATGFLVGRILR
jgi:hypothetical protein